MPSVRDIDSLDLPPSLLLLSVQFPGQILIPFISAATRAGWKSQTARNLLSAGKFPLPTTTVGSRRFVHIADLANYLESKRAGGSACATPPQAPKRKPGRPTKAAQLARAAGGAK